MGRAWCASMTWPAIEKIGGCVEGFDPKTRRHGCMKEESTHTVIERPEDALGLPVLLACVRTREPEMSAVATKERPNGSTVELTPVVGLERENRKLKLCFDIRVEIKQDREYFRFVFEGKRPHVVCVVI